MLPDKAPKKGMSTYCIAKNSFISLLYRSYAPIHFNPPLNSSIMKTFFLILCTLVLSLSNANAQVTAYKIEVGDQLTYQVEAGDKEYDFIMTPTRLDKSGISFEYEMTAPANKKGMITMTADALSTSNVLYNHFSGGDVELNDQTSVFISQAMMEAATNGNGTFFAEGIEEPGDEFNTLEGNTSPANNSTYLKLKKKVGGKEYAFDGPIMETADGEKVLRFTDGGGYPFITYMKLGFRVYLKEIKRGK